MKKNNKGFMLVEVIIVSVVVAIIMTTLYVAFVKVYNNYELKETYTNIDAVYAVKTIEDFLIDDFKIVNLLNNSSEYNEINCSSFSDVNYCNNVFSRYNINKIYLLKLNNSNDRVPDLPSDVNQTFKDYIIYLNNAVSFDDEISHIFVIETYEISDEDNGIEEKDILNRYAYLEVK